MLQEQLWQLWLQKQARQLALPLVVLVQPPYRVTLLIQLRPFDQSLTLFWYRWWQQRRMVEPSGLLSVVGWQFQLFAKSLGWHHQSHCRYPWSPDLGPWTLLLWLTF